jgi:pyruvate dehydrogenase E2 component (dihydrolipoamide acetyltransferase)
MPTDVIMPALELAQESGTVLRWLKAPGDRVDKGEPIVEIETDKITTEIEAPASGFLGDVTAGPGDVVPVGRAIARILEQAGAAAARSSPPTASAGRAPASAAGAPPSAPSAPARPPASTAGVAPVGGRAAGAVNAGAGASAPGTTGIAAPSSPAAAIKASPLARRIAEQHGVDLADVKTASGRIEKADVLEYVERRKVSVASAPAVSGAGAAARLAGASPKARRLAAERGVDLAAVRGSGPGGAVLAGDVVAAAVVPPRGVAAAAAPGAAAERHAETIAVGTVWRIMAERMATSWTSAPHFYLVREVNVSRLVSWLDRARTQTRVRVTYTDLLVKLVAAAIAQHPRLNVSWRDGAIARNADVNIGVAVAIDDGLVVPVIHRADALGLAELTARRDDLVTRAQAGKLRPADIQGGGFTISNLGMYGVDAFSAILNPPQAAILAVGRIADRVIAANGQPVVQPTMVLTLSCDHRAVDGARAAAFLGALADLIEEPLTLLV